MNNLKSKNLCTAITPSGGLTLAHYLFIIVSLLKNTEYNLFVSIADLHAITTPHQINQLIKIRKETTIYLFACGIKPGDLFIQSQIHGHGKLCFILGCHINIGHLKRMTQFKSKGDSHNQLLGLLNYPLLMASDILLYDADVLVGNDQKQHVELTRDLAIKLNNKVGKNIFYAPKIVERIFFKYRVRDLQDPAKKMSKTSERRLGVIFLSDTVEEITKKITIAKTDSDNTISFDDFEQKPGVSNLILIYALLQNLTIEDAEKYLQQKCKNYAELKKILIKNIIGVIKPLQAKVQKLRDDPSQIQQYLAKGKKRAQAVVDKKFKQIQSDLGFGVDF